MLSNENEELDWRGYLLPQMPMNIFANAEQVPYFQMSCDLYCVAGKLQILLTSAGFLYSNMAAGKGFQHLKGEVGSSWELWDWFITETRQASSTGRDATQGV